MLSFLVGAYLGGVLVGAADFYYMGDLTLSNFGSCLVWPLPLLADLWAVTVPVVVKTVGWVKVGVAKVVALVNKLRGK